MGLRRKRKKILLLLLLAGLVCLIVTRSGNYSKTTSSLSADSESCKLAQTYNISGHRIFHKGNQPMLTCKRFCDPEESPQSSPGCVKEDIHDDFIFCLLKDSNSQKYSAECSENEACSPGFHLGISSRNSSKLEWEYFSSSKSLSFYIKSLLDKSNTKKHEGYVVLKCNLKTPKTKSEDLPAAGFQLLVLPPKLSLTNKAQYGAPKISINLVLLDSISRYDIYNSLPLTLATMTTLNTDQASRAEVLDYAWVQDLGKENNLAALTSGAIPGIGLGELFGHFSSAGYSTAWHSYSCWEEREGLATYLGLWDRQGALDRGLSSKPTIEQFLTALKLAGIDSTGISSSACHIPSSSCSPQHIPSLLSSSLLHTSALSSHRQNHFSVVSFSNQTKSFSKDLDKHLSSYLLSLSSQPHTITILTSLSSSSPTSSLPLFLMFPHRTRSLLSDPGWQSLLTNQDRLASLLDLHFTLIRLLKINKNIPELPRPSATTLSPSHLAFLSRYVPNPKGLMSEISVGRYCPDLPRSEFLCQCQPVREVWKGKGEGLGEVVTQWWNMQNSRGETSCVRVSMEQLSSAQFSTYGQGDTFYRVEVRLVVELESEHGVELKEKGSKIKLKGLIDQEISSGNIKIVVEGEVNEKKLCIQQFNTQEESRREVGWYVDRVRSVLGGRLDSLFTENGVDCLWLVVRQLEAGTVIMVQLASSCSNQVEAVLDFRVGEGTIAQSRGEQRVVMNQGEVLMANVFMGKFTTMELPSWEYVLLDINYIESDEE